MQLRLKSFLARICDVFTKGEKEQLSLNLAQEHVVFAVNVEDILVWKSVLWIDFCLDKFCGTNIKKSFVGLHSVFTQPT